MGIKLKIVRMEAKQKRVLKKDHDGMGTAGL